MRHTIRHTLVLLLLLTSAAGAGSIYKWVDDQGVTHYSDQAPEANQVVEGAVETRQGVAGSSPVSPPPPAKTANPPETMQPPAARERKDVTVEIYTTSWCRYCRDAKNYFQSRGIVFKEYDIEKDRKAARRHKRYNPRGGVPVTVINGRPIVGFAPAAFAQALNGS
jgi:glutaredoxin-like YruB-family protein